MWLHLLMPTKMMNLIQVKCTQWEGNLLSKYFKLGYLKDIPPTIEFEDTISGIQKIDRKKASLNVMARDFPDDNWTITSAVAPREILIFGKRN